MAKPFDGALKPLVETDPNALVDLLRTLMRLPAGRAEPVDADLSTVAPQSDMLLRLGDAALLDLAFQASRDPQTLARMQVHNAIGAWRHRLPCLSVLFLLRRAADWPECTGEWTQSVEGFTTAVFRYAVVRVWELPLAPLLAEPHLATLAALTDAAAADLPGVVRQAAARIEAEGGRDVPDLLATMRILAGLRYDRATVAKIFQGVRVMRESSVYQEIVQEGEARGRAEEARRLRRLLQRQGERRFGPLPAQHAARLAKLAPEPLEELFDRLPDVAGWDELFA